MVILSVMLITAHASGTAAGYRYQPPVRSGQPASASAAAAAAAAAPTGAVVVGQQPYLSQGSIRALLADSRVSPAASPSPQQQQVKQQSASAQPTKQQQAGSSSPAPLAQFDLAALLMAAAQALAASGTMFQSPSSGAQPAAGPKMSTSFPSPRVQPEQLLLLPGKGGQTQLAQVLSSNSGRGPAAAPAPAPAATAPTFSAQPFTAAAPRLPLTSWPGICAAVATAVPQPLLALVLAASAANLLAMLALLTSACHAAGVPVLRHLLHVVRMRGGLRVLGPVAEEALQVMVERDRDEGEGDEGGAGAAADKREEGGEEAEEASDGGDQQIGASGSRSSAAIGSSGSGSSASSDSGDIAAAPVATIATVPGAGSANASSSSGARGAAVSKAGRRLLISSAWHWGTSPDGPGPWLPLVPRYLLPTDGGWLGPGQMARLAILAFQYYGCSCEGLATSSTTASKSAPLPLRLLQSALCWAKPEAKEDGTGKQQQVVIREESSLDGAGKEEATSCCVRCAPAPPIPAGCTTCPADGQGPITTLELEHLEGTELCVVVSRGLAALPHVKRLHLRWCELHGRCVCVSAWGACMHGGVFSSVRTLLTLAEWLRPIPTRNPTSNPPCTTRRALRPLLEVLRRHPALTALTLERCELDDAAADLLRSLLEGQHAPACSCRASGAGAADSSSRGSDAASAIAAGGAASVGSGAGVETLRLVRCTLSVAAASTLADALTRARCLRAFVFSSNTIEPSTGRAVAAAAFAHALQHVTSGLRHLTLGFSRGCTATAEVLAAAVGEGHVPASLRHVVLHRREISPRGLAAWATALGGAGIGGSGSGSGGGGSAAAAARKQALPALTLRAATLESLQALVAASSRADAAAGSSGGATGSVDAAPPAATPPRSHRTSSSDGEEHQWLLFVEQLPITFVMEADHDTVLQGAWLNGLSQSLAPHQRQQAPAPSADQQQQSDALTMGDTAPQRDVGEGAQRGGAAAAAALQPSGNGFMGGGGLLHQTADSSGAAGNATPLTPAPAAAAPPPQLVVLSSSDAGDAVACALKGLPLAALDLAGLELGPRVSAVGCSRALLLGLSRGTLERRVLRVRCMTNAPLLNPLRAPHPPIPPTFQSSHHPQGSRAVAAALPLAPALRSVNLSSTGLGDDAAVSLAGALPACTALTALVLERNCVADRGALALVAALEAGACPALRVLSLNGNRFPLEWDTLIRLRDLSVARPHLRVELLGPLGPLAQGTALGGGGGSGVPGSLQQRPPLDRMKQGGGGDAGGGGSSGSTSSQQVGTGAAAGCSKTVLTRLLSSQPIISGRSSSNPAATRRAAVVVQSVSGPAAAAPQQQHSSSSAAAAAHHTRTDSSSDDAWSVASDDVCGVCFDRPNSLHVVGCGHLLCIPCYRRVVVGPAGGGGVPPTTAPSCPFCRGRIEGFAYCEFVQRAVLEHFTHPTLITDR